MQLFTCASRFLLLGLVFALWTAVRTFPLEAARVFVASYFMLPGLRMVFGGVHDPEILLGDLFASLGLTYFWIMRRK